MTPKARAQEALEEIWKPIPMSICKDRYEVSNFGRVRTVGFVVKKSNGTVKAFPARMLKQTKHPLGYLRVNFRRGDKKATKLAHVIVMLAFVGEKPKGKQINHIDKNKKNNRLDNLEYVSSLENNFHCHKMKNGYAGYQKKVNTYEVSLTVKGKRKYIGCFKSPKEAMDAYIAALKKYGVENKYAERIEE